MHMSRGTSAAAPTWTVWMLAVPGVLAVCAALLDFDDKPSSGVPLRARIGLLGLALLALAWTAANAKLNRRRG